MFFMLCYIYTHTCTQENTLKPPDGAAVESAKQHQVPPGYTLQDTE